MNKINELKTFIENGYLEQEIIEELTDIYVIHYSPTAKNIYNDKAFVYGEIELSNLDYTLDKNNNIKNHKQAGFNFAFHLDKYSEQYDVNEAILPEMGLLSFGCHNNAVVFKIKKGLYTKHKVDNFNQIIFYNEDIYKDSFIYMERKELDEKDVYDENGNIVFDYWTVEKNDFIFNDQSLAFNTEECLEYIKEKFIKNENKKYKNFRRYR